MRTTLVNCPYCNSNQKIFHISYNLKKFLNNFKQEKIFILGTYNKKQEIIKKFNCNKCSETLFIYYDIEKSQYFVILILKLNNKDFFVKTNLICKKSLCLLRVGVVSK